MSAMSKSEMDTTIGRHHNRSVDDWIHNRESGMIDFRSALKAVQNLIAPQEFGSIRVEVRSAGMKQ